VKYLSIKRGKFIATFAGAIFVAVGSPSMAAELPKPCTIKNQIDPETKAEYTGAAELGVSGGSVGAPRFGWRCELKTLADLIEADVNMQTTSGERAPLNFADIKIGRNPRTGFTTIGVDFYPLCAPKCPDDYEWREACPIVLKSSG
jgi:hypothetical protein